MRNLLPLRASLLALPFAFVVGCAVAPAGTEETGRSEDEMKIKFTTSLVQPPMCDSTTMCCFGGGDPLTDSSFSGACGQALAAAGCTQPNDQTKAYANAVAQDLSGHWWFDVQCPSTMTAIPAACTASPFDAYFPSSDYTGAGAACMGAADAGFSHLLYDPNCGSGCFKTIGST